MRRCPEPVRSPAADRHIWPEPPLPRVASTYRMSEGAGTDGVRCGRGRRGVRGRFRRRVRGRARGRIRRSRSMRSGVRRGRSPDSTGLSIRGGSVPPGRADGGRCTGRIFRRSPGPHRYSCIRCRRDCPPEPMSRTPHGAAAPEQILRRRLSTLSRPRDRISPRPRSIAGGHFSWGWTPSFSLSLHCRTIPESVCTPGHISQWKEFSAIRYSRLPRTACLSRVDEIVAIVNDKFAVQPQPDRRGSIASGMERRGVGAWLRI